MFVRDGIPVFVSGRARNPKHKHPESSPTLAPKVYFFKDMDRDIIMLRFFFRVSINPKPQRPIWIQTPTLLECLEVLYTEIH